MSHDKGLFTVHLCIEDTTIIGGKVYVHNLWSEFDQNISPGIIIPDLDVVPCYEIPKETIENFEALEALRLDLLDVSAVDQVMRIVVKHHLE